MARKPRRPSAEKSDLPPKPEASESVESAEPKSEREVLRDRLRTRVRELPQTPGVYLMKNAAEKILYVGKAKSLRNRVRSYFSESPDLPAKTRFLVAQIDNIDFILTNTEVEAFLLEASLIKKHRPKYNIRLRDDKAYPYIRLSGKDEFPRFYLSRRVQNDGASYFGPYTSGAYVAETIRFLNRTFLVRDCQDTFMKTRKRPCLTHEIGRCRAPCVGLVTAEEYSEDLKGATLFLRGKNQSLLKDLKKKMEQASKAERYEAAAKYRDSLRAVEAILERQVVVKEGSQIDQDVVGFFGDERGTMIATLHVRAGRLIGSRHHFLPLLDFHAPEEDPREWLISFLNQYYEENFVPDEVLLATDVGLDMKKLLEAVLKERGHKAVRVRFPTDEAGSRLLEKVEREAREQFKNYLSKTEKKLKGLEEIQRKFQLLKIPQRIECFDISTFQGAETVASQVVFEEGVPAKDFYRRYRIKSVKGIDDFASMKEVLQRRLGHTEYGMPDLIVVDGGKGQLGKAVEILRELGHEGLPVVGLAKARTIGSFQDSEVKASEERFFLPGRQNPVVFATSSEAYQILVGIRDEAHRFAITYHRKLRENSTLESELDAVVGLGEKRKKDLLHKFQSLEEIRSSTVDELASIKGFNRVLAERILLHLNSDPETESELESPAVAEMKE